MKRRLIFVGIFMVLVVIVAVLGFRFRELPAIQQLTNKLWFYSLVNQTAKVTDIAFFVYDFYPKSLPRYQLFVEGRELIKLQFSLPNPNSVRVVADWPTEVPGSFIDDQGNEYPVRIKYRGNTFTHWAFAKKSYRLSFPKEKTFKGLESIDLIIPEDRGLAREDLANFRASKLGLLAPENWFVNLSINQKSHGVYYVSEKIDVDFFLRRHQAGTLFAPIDDTSRWRESVYVTADRWQTLPRDPNHPDWQHLRKLISLLNRPETKVSQLLELIDRDNFIAWRAHAILMGTFAQDAAHNNRLFFNHEKNRFQFIPWDTGSSHGLAYRDDINQVSHPLVKKLLTDEQLKKEVLAQVRDYLDQEDNMQADSVRLNSTLDQILPELYKDNLKFFADIKYWRDSRLDREWIDEFPRTIRSQL